MESSSIWKTTRNIIKINSHSNGMIVFVEDEGRMVKDENIYDIFKIIPRESVFHWNSCFIRISWRWNLPTFKSNSILFLPSSQHFKCLSSLIFLDKCRYLIFLFDEKKKKVKFIFYFMTWVSWSWSHFKFNKQKPLCILRSFFECGSSLIWNRNIHWRLSLSSLFELWNWWKIHIFAFSFRRIISY